MAIFICSHIFLRYGLFLAACLKSLESFQFWCKVFFLVKCCAPVSALQVLSQCFCVLKLVVKFVAGGYLGGAEREVF